jgi:uncharacterized protein (TIGR02145 family)
MVGFVACGDESSSGPSNNETALAISSSIEDLESSSSVNEALSSSNVTELSSSDKALAPSSSEKSSSSKKVESSSSSKTDVSSSSTKIESSSSSVNVKESSSSSKVESSSSKDDVSSSSQNVQSSSSDKPVESSSSKAKSSSSEISSSSKKIEESSSSVESSSSAVEVSSCSVAIIPSKDYDCNVYNCVPTTYLNPEIDYGELLDTRDNQVYRTVEIGTQTWMAQNLNYKVEHSFCLKQKDSLCVIYGRYYPFSVAMDSVNQGGCGNGEGCERQISHQGICPNGWHLPDSLEFDYLIKFISKDKNEKYFSRAVRSKMLWSDSMGLDEFGFSLLPTGRVLFAKYDGSYAYSKSEHKQYICLWGNGWKKDGPNENTGYTIIYRGGKIQVEDNGYVFLLGDNLWETDQITSQAFNVRCVKNN